MKKIVSLILVFSIIIGLVSVTAQADVVITKDVPIEKYMSLLDLSSIPVGTTCTSGIPEGLKEIGINPFTTNWAHKHGFDGIQSIVANEDGSKSWKLEFTTAFPSGGWMNNFSNEFTVSFAVPTEYAKRIRSISIDVDYSSTKNLGYHFGVYDGTYASFMKDSGDTFDGNFSTSEGAGGTKMAFDYRILNLRKIEKNLVFQSKTASDTAVHWAEGDEITHIYLTMVSRNCDGTEGGYALINDIGFTYYDTETEVVGTEGEDRSFKLLDLSDYEDGKLFTLPSGVSEFKPSTSDSFSDIEEVITDVNGDKALKLDFSNSAVTYNSDATDCIIGGGYSNVYGLKFKIPTNHLPLIEYFNFKYEKQSDNEIIYNFGVTDGVSLSKEGKEGNFVIPADFKGEDYFITYTEMLNLVDENAAGSYGGGDETWESREFTDVFLWLTIKPEKSEEKADGYFIINDISYSFFATDAQIEENKGFITGFENKNGVETTYATGGNRALEINSGSGKTVYKVEINNNKNLKESTGISFWVYNPTTTTANFKVCLKGKGTVSYVANDSYSIPAGEKKKIYIDFSAVYRDKAPSNTSGFTQGVAVSLSKAQVGALSSITLLCREKNLTLYADDFWFTFVKAHATTATLPLNKATGEGLKVNDGKLVFDSSKEGSMITATIPVENFEFDAAKDLTLNFTSDVVAEYYVKLYGTNDEGNAAHWRWGFTKRSGDKIPVSEDYTYKFSMAGYNAQYNRNNIHEAEGDSCWICWSDTSSGHNNNPPSSFEKGTVHTIEIRVFNNVGTEDQAVILNSVTITYEPNSVTLNQAENGTVSVNKTSAYAGDIIDFTAVPKDGYYLKRLKTTYENGIEIATINKRDGSNISNLYSCEMPHANLVVTPEFEKISETGMYSVDYSGDNAIIKYSIPLKDRKAYSTSAGKYEAIDDFAVMFVAQGALDKYGFKAEELTYEKISELTEKGHHIVNYIYRVDMSKGKKWVNGRDGIEVVVNIEEISVYARRASLAIMVFADFANDSVADFESIAYKSIDKYYYGDDLEETFDMVRGINYDQVMQGNLPTIDPNTHRVFKVETWQDIKAHGFDHVRLPVNLNKSTDLYGNINEKHLDKLEMLVETILRSGMRVVIDLHGFKDFNTNFVVTRPEFLYVWEQLSERFAHLPLSAAFQLINEPRFQDKSGPDVVTRKEIMSIQEEAIDIIRPIEGNEKRYIAFSTQINMSNDAEMNSITQKILDTEYLIWDVHYYGPMSFTHSGNDWSSDPYPAGATEWSDSGNKNTIVKLANFEKEHPNIIVWLGEWGAFNPDYTEKMKYYTSITSYAKEYGISWAIWDFASSWGPYNLTNGWKNDFLTAMGMAEYID